MYNFPNNPTVGQIAQFPSASQQYIWNGFSWDGAPLSEEFVTGSGGTSVSASYSDTASLSYNSISSSYALTASYISGAIQSDPILIAGPGIVINGLRISSSLLSVNGTYPDASGNVSTALTEVITGTSASLLLSSSGDVTSSITEGSVWVVSGDTDPSQNGKSWIYSFDGSIGTWYPLSSLDIPAADARYLMLNPQAPLSGPLTAPYGVIGTSSWSNNSVYAITASYLLGNNIIPTEIVWPDKTSNWQWGINFGYGNKIFAVGSNYSFRVTGVANSADQSGLLYEVPVTNRPSGWNAIYTQPGNIWAIGTNGVAYSYGINNYGQLGNGTNANQFMRPLAPITALSGSGKIVERGWISSQMSTNHSDNNVSQIIWRVSDNGTTKYFGHGWNQYGNLGIGNTIGTTAVPTEIVPFRGKNIVSMSIGGVDGTTGMALEADGTPWVWGYNAVGQCGIGNTTNQPNPIIPRSGSGLATISGVKEVQSAFMSDDSTFSWYNTYILKNDGTVLGAGNGADYLRGDGQNTASPNYFTDVKTSATTKLQNIVKLYCKGWFRGALDSTGNLWAWGKNNWGAWGDGSAENSLSQWAKIIATGVEDLSLEIINSRITRLYIKQGGEWYSSGFNGGYSLLIGYRDGASVISRKQMVLPTGKEIKRWIPIGTYANTNIEGVMFQTSDNSIYVGGYTQYVLGSGAGYIASPTKLNWNLD